MRTKFRLGLFDDPYVDPDEAERIVGCDAHRDARARSGAQDDHAAQERRTACCRSTQASSKTIAVIGPNADRELLGGYSGKPKHRVTVLEGIRQRVGAGVEVLYHEGCKITIGGSWQQDDVTPSDPDEDRRTIAEAVELARRGRRGRARHRRQRADVARSVDGQSPGRPHEPRHGRPAGRAGRRDRRDRQADRRAAVRRPAAVDPQPRARRPRRFSSAGTSARKPAGRSPTTLFGDVNPGGKLPITIPRSVGHLPAFYNHKPSARRGYLFDDVSPLFPFGYGLSYTKFAFATSAARTRQIGRDESTRVLGRRDQHGHRAPATKSCRCTSATCVELGDAAGEGAQGLPGACRSSRARRRP